MSQGSINELLSYMYFTSTTLFVGCANPFRDSALEIFFVGQNKKYLQRRIPKGIRGCARHEGVSLYNFKPMKRIKMLNM